MRNDHVEIRPSNLGMKVVCLCCEESRPDESWIDFVLPAEVTSLEREVAVFTNLHAKCGERK